MPLAGVPWSFPPEARGRAAGVLGYCIILFPGLEDSGLEEERKQCGSGRGRQPSPRLSPKRATAPQPSRDEVI